MDDTAVANASPLILLSRTGRLDLIRVAGSAVVVPRPVADEIGMKGGDDITHRAMRETSWLSVVPAPRVPQELAVWELGAGESSVLAWALVHPGSVALLDDLEARRCAESLQIPLLGTVGIVLLARRRGVIPLARPVLEELVSAGMYLAERTLAEALRRVGE